MNGRSPLPFRFVDGAIHIPELGLWLDAHRSITGPERVVVSHAHSDHTAAHREVVLSAPTSQLMRTRLGSARRIEHHLPYGERRAFTWQERTFHLTLRPAGHILGSVMTLVEWDGATLLYTGDFKTRQSLAAEPCDIAEFKGVDSLVMETTFGLSKYRFPAAPEVLGEVIRFCREALEAGDVPILFGYSLGKSQELLCGLAETGFELMLHESTARMTTIYEQLAWRIPRYELLDVTRARGKVLICPPGSNRSGPLEGLTGTRTALVTGWALDSGCRFRARVDAAFPLSDHADYPDLIDFVRQIAPKQVFTLHGFAVEFAETLRELGFDARALGQCEQLSLPLLGTPARAPWQPAEAKWDRVERG